MELINNTIDLINFHFDWFHIEGWENFFIFIIYAAYLHIILGGDKDKNKDDDKNKDNPPPPPKEDKKGDGKKS